MVSRSKSSSSLSPPEGRKCSAARRRRSPRRSSSVSFNTVSSEEGRTMTNEILVVADHQKGVLADTTYEMLGAGQTLAASLNVPVSAALVGSGVEALAGSLGAAKVVL